MGKLIEASEWLEETIPVPDEGTLYVYLDRGSVEVSSQEANEVRIEASARGWGAGMAHFSLDQDGRDVQLDGDLDRWLPGLFGGARLQVRAWVPRRYAVEIETRGGRIAARDIGGRFAAQTTGGEIEIQRIDGPTMVRTSGSRIRAHEVNGDLRARTSGGRIEVAYVNGDVEVRTSGGRIEVHGAAGSVDARTSGGPIDVSFVDEPAGCLETSGGPIEVVFPGGSGTDLDARTSGGRIEVDHDLEPIGPVRRHHVVGRVNGGGPPLRLRTSGGRIRVRSA